MIYKWNCELLTFWDWILHFEKFPLDLSFPTLVLFMTDLYSMGETYPGAYDTTMHMLSPAHWLYLQFENIPKEDARKSIAYIFVQM